MYRKSPHISIANVKLIERVLGVSEEDIAKWPEYTKETVESLCSEIFLIRYNPYIPSEVVFKSVFKQLEDERGVLDEDVYNLLVKGLKRFWEEYLEDKAFSKKVISRLKKYIDPKHIYTSPNHLVECSTDATDLRVELPMFVVAPGCMEEVKKVVELANEMKFYLVPRGGGSGLTGGAIPCRPRTVILSLSRMKKILSINKSSMTMCAQSGVITLNAAKEAARYGLLFTVDPASKASSSIGGNISENAGGPFAFEYGTTLDNILSYKMVLANGKSIEVKRKAHPRHKILPHEVAVFEIYSEDNTLIDVVELKGDEIRGTGLGKDVTNKYLGGLPGVQKEGVDGIITEACFVLYKKLPFSSTLCLEFYGNTMENAMLVIKDLVKLRDEIRKKGDKVKMSALEEFGAKYVQAIEYKKKSISFEGDPISVLLIQLDSEDREALEQITQQVAKIAKQHENVDVFIAKHAKEAEIFWEDRHKLSAIARRTSGFKINEDIVIPIDVIPEFSKFLEELNLYYAALAYRDALQEVLKVDGVDPGDEFIDMEINFTSKILNRKIDVAKLPEQEFMLQIHFFFRDLKSRYPAQKLEISAIEQHMLNTRITIANHMHAGDGNCHVNIPVNSNDSKMMKLAEEAASKVFEKVLSLGGAISGEHGIGITKINYLDAKRVEELRKYKEIVDPNNIFNPDKLTRRSLNFVPYTFSFNKLIEDINKTSIPYKDKLIYILKNVQICSRCGKCKQVCPMYYPEEGYLYHPRNKIISLGALLEAYYYTKIVENKPNKKLLKMITVIADACTSCGRCMEMCPVKINTGEQILNLRIFLEERAISGHHPIKASILRYLNEKNNYLPKVAKVLAIGQKLQNNIVKVIPENVKTKFKHPLISGPGPNLGIIDLYSKLKAKKKNYFNSYTSVSKEEVFYFPGCGAALFFPDIGLASIYLLLKFGFSVVIPNEHMCCGYPLLAGGLGEEYEKNKLRNIKRITAAIKTNNLMKNPEIVVLTSCGTCLESISSYGLEHFLEKDTKTYDCTQFLVEKLINKGLCFPFKEKLETDFLVYHQACHVEWSGVPRLKSADIYKEKLEKLFGVNIKISPGCCGESGLGALTSPAIYYTIKKRKKKQLELDLKDYKKELPVLVGCPSCKVGLQRIFAERDYNREALHILEFLAYLVGGKKWKKELKSILKG
ncbi:FAD-binding and (Fe-S)-binding domain-containing protein [Desulfothermus sp.]